jgi:exonuclease III
MDDNNNNNNLGLVNITFAAKNCQSLNISTKNEKTFEKILALVKGGEDVIFLSDLKLNSVLQKHAIHDLEKKIFNLQYKFWHNSKASSRGVGILIRSDIFIKELERIDDNNNNNFLLLKVELNSGVWVLGSIYGPNDNDINFFMDLEAGLEKLNNQNMVIGGYWNATWDSRPVNQTMT